MKKFLKYGTLFSLPIVIYLIAIELITAQIPNSYSYKYNYVKTNGDKIQALAIGHSQLYDAFMPELFFLPSFNLCNSDQYYIDNFYLFCELLQDMPNLKVVIMPIGYVNVRTEKNSSLMERICYYHKYMNLNYDGRLPLKYRFECFDPKKARDKISLYYNRHVDMVGCDSLGRRSTHYLKDRTHDVDYPHFLEKYTIKEKDYNKYCLLDEDYLIKTIKLLTERNISVVFVSPPYYWDYGFKGVNEEQKRFLGNYMDKLCSSFPSIHYLNLESDTSYTYDDFFDETHLTELGAEKFTKRLNDFVMDFMTE